MPIFGYKNGQINRLRLWQAEAVNEFDFNRFNNFDYDGAVREKNEAEDLTRVLYPNDERREGKLLRIKQQYFFVSASLQDIVSNYKKNFDDKEFKHFHEYVSIQLNDTHPVIGIPELIRILLDEEKISFEDSFNIARKIFNFTNHTILREAMEVWSVDLIDETSPRVLEIIQMIEQRLVEELYNKGFKEEEINFLRIVKDDSIHMANLAIFVSNKVNGVAELHTNILKNETLKDWYGAYPYKFTNKTNGVTQRRWLIYSNMELSDFIDRKLGSNEWREDFSKIKELEKFAEDEPSIREFLEIRKKKKIELTEIIKETTGIDVDPNSIFDVQVKRLHEYKRQLLNALHIVYLYHRLKEDKNFISEKRTFIFGAKAAPAYFRAKAVIKFINEIARVINNDKDIDGKIKVVFLENFRVSLGEKIYPACDFSEQISTAGKEASGTGNMKFMMNGAITIGTYDGANVEIFEKAGEENNIRFGKTVEELMEIKPNYDPYKIYQEDIYIKNALDSLMSGEFKDNESYMFLDIYNSLLKSEGGDRADRYFVLEDFESYRKAQEKISEVYKDEMRFGKMCLLNIANSAYFSSDRTIREYAEEIWKLESHN